MKMAHGIPLEDEQEILDSLRQLNAQTISIVFDTYFPEVYRYVRFRLGDEALAEDIASDVFVRLLEAVHKRHGPTKNIRGWLFGTASHMVADQLRVHYRKPIESLSVYQVSPDTAPLDVVEKRENAIRLRKALASLSKDQQLVLALRFGEGCSLEQTASILNRNINTIKTLQFRALTALNRKIEEAA